LARLEPFSHRSRDLVEIVDLAYTVPDDASRLASEPAHGVPPIKKRNGILKPEKLNQRAAITVLVDLPGPQLCQNEAGRRDFGEQDLPPGRNQNDGIVQVSFPDDQCRAVEDSAIQRHLAAESPQTVAVRLDLVPVQRPVHVRHIDENFATAQPQLLEQYALFVPRGRRTQNCEQSISDLAVAGLRFTARRLPNFDEHAAFSSRTLAHESAPSSKGATGSNTTSRIFMVGCSSACSDR
jgi:hypothetical protein